VRFDLDHPALNALGVMLAWVASLMMGALFYRVIGQGLMPRLGIVRRPAKTPTLPAGASKQSI